MLRHGTGVATRGPSLLYRDRKFFVATKNLSKSFTRENFILRELRTAGRAANERLVRTTARSNTRLRA